MKNLVTLGKLQDGKLLQLDVRRFIQTRMSVMGSSGSGKTYALLQLLEALRGLMPQCVFDLEGDFTHLRRKPGYNYVLAAPKGGDVVAHPSTAAVLARHFMERNFSLIVDMYEMDLLDQRRFVRLFCEAMLLAPRKLWRPRLIMADECHELAPEKGGDSAESLGALVRVAKKGRKRGLALVAATQRPADIAKALTSQLGNKLIGVAFSDIDQDRAAKELRIRDHAKADEIGLLEPGHFFAKGPALGQDLKVVTMSMPTDRPDEGGKASLRRPPAPSDKLKAILGSLAELPKEALEEAKTMAELKEKVRGLEQQLRQAKVPASVTIQNMTEAQKKDLEKMFLASRPQAIVTNQPDPNIIKAKLKELDAFNKKKLKLMEVRLINRYKMEANSFKRDVVSLVMNKVQSLSVNVTAGLLKEVLEQPLPAGLRTVATAPAPMKAPIVVKVPESPKVFQGIKAAYDGELPKFNEAQRKILAFLLTQPEGKTFTFVQVGAMVQMSGNGGHFGNQVSALAKPGIVVRDNGTVTLKDRALAMQVVGDMQVLSGRQAMEAWLQKFGELPRKIYQALLDNPGRIFPLPELAEYVGGKMGGHFGNCVSEVATVGLAIRRDGKVWLNPDLENL